MRVSFRTAAVAAVVAAASSAAALPARADEGGFSAAVVNGETTTIAQHPHLAALLFHDEPDRYLAQFCGGSVVTSRIVLTAAHCVDFLAEFPGDVDVLVGSDDLTSPAGDRVQVQAITVHPGWDRFTAVNDLALLSLSSAVAAPPIGVVPEALDRFASAGTTAEVTGFGCTAVVVPDNDCTEYPTDLYTAEVTIKTDAWCETVLDSYVPGIFDPRLMLCAGDEAPDGTAPDPCFGDSGGPLTAAGPAGTRLLVGVVSWGAGCGSAPSVYTRLARHRTWLREHGVPVPRPAFAAGPAVDVGGTYVPIVGDFDGNFRDDILWYTPGDGRDALWRGTTGGFTAGPAVTVGGDYTPIVGDFNGDRRDDILWYTPGDGRDALWRGTASAGKAYLGGPEVSVAGDYTPVIGDFNGDTRDDLLWYTPGAGRDALWRGTATGFGAGPEVDVAGVYAPVPGDFNGDGRADILWYVPGTGRDGLWRGTSVTGKAFAGGPPVDVTGTYTPVPGDFNGDGRADILWYAPGPDRDGLWRGLSVP